VGCLGSHFALSKEQADEVCQLSSEEELYEFFEDRKWDNKWSLYGDKFWDGLHRCLTDGTLDDCTPPLADAVLGEGWGEIAETGGVSYFVNVLDHDQVRACLEAMNQIDRDELRENYDALDQAECDWQLCDDDFTGHWLYFKRVRAFFKRAAVANRWVAFTVNW
jgi:hypothetical protein